MTTFEYLKTLSLYDFAEWLCTVNMDCNTCRAKSECNGFKQDGFLNLLSQERKEKAAKHEGC